MNYIGIDIGDGESCVCVLPAGSQIEPRPVEITGRKSFLSAVSGTSDADIRIGMDAVAKGASEGFSVRFKSRFLKNEARSREDMRRFLKGIADQLREKKILDGECRITVGCPAGWRDETREVYERMVRDAGFTDSRLVSESRAAFLYAKYARSIQLDPSLIENSALVVDIGSSTLDFAYVTDGRETDVGTFGDVYLGGGAIDEALLEAAVSASPEKKELRRIFEEAPEWRAYCLLAARRVKEDFFTRESEGEKNVRSGETLTVMYDRSVALRITADETMILRVIQLPIKALNQVSFYQMLKNALSQAAEKTKERPPALLLLTGGASRMGFFQKLCRERFPDTQIVLCEEPEYSIAKGLAYAGRVDDSILAFNQAIDELLEEDLIRRTVSERLNEVIGKVSGVMADLGTDVVRKHLQDWQKGIFRTLQDMNMAMKPQIRSAISGEQATDMMRTMLVNELNHVCAVIQPRVDELCRRYGISSSQMVLRMDDVDRPDVKTEIDVDTGPLQKSIQLMITGFVALIMLIIPGGQLIDIAVTAATFVSTLLFKKEVSSFTDRLDLPVRTRSLFPLDRKVNDQFRDRMKEEFVRELSANETFRRQLEENIEDSLKVYVRSMARRTEISIT